MNDDPAPPWYSSPPISTIPLCIGGGLILSRAGCRKWNKANVQSVGGGFLVVDGDPTGLDATPALPQLAGPAVLAVTV